MKLCLLAYLMRPPNLAFQAENIDRFCVAVRGSNRRLENIR
jgi:hypothetical protein